MRGIDGGVYADLAPMHVVRAQTGGVVGCGGGHFHFLAFLQQVPPQRDAPLSSQITGASVNSLPFCRFGLRISLYMHSR